MSRDQKREDRAAKKELQRQIDQSPYEVKSEDDLAAHVGIVLYGDDRAFVAWRRDETDSTTHRLRDWLQEHHKSVLVESPGTLKQQPGVEIVEVTYGFARGLAKKIPDSARPGRVKEVEDWNGMDEVYAQLAASLGAKSKRPNGVGNGNHGDNGYGTEEIIDRGHGIGSVTTQRPRTEDKEFEALRKKGGQHYAEPDAGGVTVTDSEPKLHSNRFSSLLGRLYTGGALGTVDRGDGDTATYFFTRDMQLAYEAFRTFRDAERDYEGFGVQESLKGKQLAAREFQGGLSKVQSHRDVGEDAVFSLKLHSNVANLLQREDHEPAIYNLPLGQVEGEGIRALAAQRASMLPAPAVNPPSQQTGSELA